jgi:hypothetical protein
MAKHLMVDIETLGAGHLPVVASVGLCSFDPESGEIEKPHTLLIDVLAHEWASVDVRTVLWWFKQERSVVAATFEAGPRVSMSTALEEIEKLARVSDSVWAKGTDFDLRILQDWWEQARPLDGTWPDRLVPYWKRRDARPMFDIIRDRLPQRVGPKHDAGEDAYYQAQVVCKAFGLRKLIK